MKKISARWRMQVWIAVFAILMNALAPSISHAVAYANGAPSSYDICRADTSTAGKSKPQAATMDHCGYCLPHAGSYAITPTNLTGLGLMGGHALRPFLFYRAPAPLLALSAAPPRGPPSLC
jgi:hypothetical protein